MTYYCPCDTETGGLNAEEADVLTLYMAIFDEDFKMVDELDLKLKPDGGRLPIAHVDALRVNGIDIHKHLEDPGTITYSEAKEKLVGMLKKYYKKAGGRSNMHYMGYNCLFDKQFILKYLIPQAEWEKLFHYKHLDVMERVDFLKEALWFPPEVGSLGTVSDYLQLPKRQAHTAKDDTLMSVDVYLKLLEIMKSKKENVAAQQDLIQLLEA